MMEAYNPAFVITEDDLTDAIFHGCSLPSRGSGTMAEARQQARIMLGFQKAQADAQLLHECMSELGCGGNEELWPVGMTLPQAVARLVEMVRHALPMVKEVA